MENSSNNNNQELIQQCHITEISENYAVDKCINNIIKKEGYTNYKIYKRLVSTCGANYIGILNQIDINGETLEGNKKISLFLKFKMSNHKLEKVTNVTKMFSKEAYIYNKLNKVFNNLQEEAGIPLHDRYNVAKSYDESNESVIILDNLAKKGYKVMHRMEVMPIKFMELSISKLAKFHGLSFVLNKKMPNYYEEIKELFTYPFIFNAEWETSMRNILKQDIEHVETNMQNKITTVLPTFLKKIPMYLKGELASVKCLCHGDYRPSNILTKEDEGEFIDAIPVDYQTFFYGSPITDFLYFIFSSTDREFRKKHLEHLKDYYHESLKGFLEYFQINVDSVYTRQQFDQDFKEYYDYGLWASLIFYPFFFTSEEDVPDLGKDGLSNVTLKLGQTFKERMEGVLQDYIDAGYL